MDSPEVSQRKASNRQPILSLVEREYLKSTANTTKAAWEPLAYLYSEADKSVHRVKRQSVPGCNGPNSCAPDWDDPEPTIDEGGHANHCLEWVRTSILKDWTQDHGWLDEILLQSQSIDALRSWQMMTGLQAQNPQPRPSGVVMPDFIQPTPPGATKAKKSMFRNGATP